MTWTAEPDSGGEDRWASRHNAPADLRDDPVCIVLVSEHRRTGCHVIEDTVREQISGTAVYNETSNPFVSHLSFAVARVERSETVEEKLSAIRNRFNVVDVRRMAPYRFHPFGTAAIVEIAEHEFS